MPKVSVNLSDDVIEAIKEIASSHQITVTEHLRRTIRWKCFWRKQKERVENPHPRQE